MDQSENSYPRLIGLKIIIGVFILSSVSAVLAFFTFHRFQFVAQLIVNVIFIVGLVRRVNAIRVLAVVFGVILAVVFGAALAGVTFFASTIRQSHWLIPFLLGLCLFEIWTVIYLRSAPVKAAFSQEKIHE